MGKEMKHNSIYIDTLMKYMELLPPVVEKEVVKLLKLIVAFITEV